MPAAPAGISRNVLLAGAAAACVGATIWLAGPADEGGACPAPTPRSVESLFAPCLTVADHPHGLATEIAQAGRLLRDQLALVASRRSRPSGADDAPGSIRR